jgi:Rho-binding antiterminator
MDTIYKPVDKAFHDELAILIKNKDFMRIQFYTDIHEFRTTKALMKDLIFKGDEEYLLLATGEEIRLDRIVRIGDQPAPGYDESFFKCDI